MEKCPKCGRECQPGYGLAGGGIGPYWYCEEHGIIDKMHDPELSTPEEMKRNANV
jgi:hypothetical protein